MTEIDLSFYQKYGLRLFPLSFGEKVPLPHSNGFYEAKKDYDPKSYEGLNIGMRCGDGIAVIDVDPRNFDEDSHEIAAKFHHIFPHTVTAHTAHMGGCHFYYQYDPSEVELKSFNIAAGIQLLAEGKYVVIPGSYNRETNKWYSWSIQDYPSKTELETLPDWVIEKSEQYNLSKIDETGEFTSVPTTITDTHWAEIESALEFLGADLAYDEGWNMVGMALHHSGHKDAFALFKRWSMTSEKYEEGCCEKKWRHYKTNPARPVTISSIYDLAHKRGWKIPEFDVGHKNWIISKPEEALDSSALPQPFPEDIPAPHFAKFARDIYDSAPYSFPYFSIFSALTIISHHAQMKFVSPTNSGLGLYVCAFADSGQGKGFYTKIVSQYCPEHTGTPVSGGGLRKAIAECVNGVFVHDEIASAVFKPIFHPKKLSPQADSIKQSLLNLFDLDGRMTIYGDAAKQETFKSPPLQDNGFSIFGTCTTADIAELLQNDDAMQAGLLNRFIFTKDTSYLPEGRPRHGLSLTTKLEDFTARLPDAEISKRIPLTWSKELSDSSWHQYRHLVLMHKDNPTHSNLLKRLDLLAIRLASLIHVYEQAMTNDRRWTDNINPEIYFWSFRVLYQNFIAIKEMAKKKVRETQDMRLDKIAQKIVDKLKIATDRRLTRSQITKGVRHTASEWDRAFSQLKKSEVIHEQKDGRLRTYTLLVDDYN